MSKALTALQRMQTSCSDLFEFYGSNLLVEELPKEELTYGKSGIVIAGASNQVNTMDKQRPLFCRILLVGAGYYDDKTGEDRPLEVQPGDIILIPELSVQWISAFGPLVSESGHRLGRTLVEEIAMRFKGQEAYDKAMESLKLATNN